MSGYYYKVYIDTTGFGHAFIEIGGPNGEYEVWGYYPKTDDSLLYAPESSGYHVILGDGRLVRDDQLGENRNKLHDFDWHSEAIPINEETFNKMHEYAQQVYNDPGTYYAGGNNCVEFVEDMIEIAGNRPFLDSTIPIQLLGNIKIRGKIGACIAEFIDRVRSLFTSGENAVLLGSPIILDLDKDGIETTALTSGTYFDLDNNGFAEQTGWASSDDGLLVMDRDNDGLIEDGTELFGNNTILADGTHASNGFPATADSLRRASINTFRFQTISR